MIQPGQDASKNETIRTLPVAASATSLKSPWERHSRANVDDVAPSSPDSTSPFRRSNPAVASLYASTLSPPSSRPMSPARQISPRLLPPESSFDHNSERELPEMLYGDSGQHLRSIVQSFAPRVSIYASEDTEVLMAKKGFSNGLWELLRPFGENVQGKVTIRDSNGISRSFEDFAVRFTRLGENADRLDPVSPNLQQTIPSEDSNVLKGSTEYEQATLTEVESLVDRHLDFAEASVSRQSLSAVEPSFYDIDPENGSPYYSLYLRRLLSSASMTSHESFAHPVACVIAISSRNDSPIEELRKLYTETSSGEKRLPPWVDNDYLRYYVLVHDEENDDITRSMSFFEQMKRHLGCHCHLLRLRCSKSAATDDDSQPLPKSDWVSATEELKRIRQSELAEECDDYAQYIFESDATAIQTFLREMVTQSIIPTMERHISIWNDQVASRRRGITGRFMNLSRKWTGFGSSSRSSSSSNINAKDAYESLGYYRADTAEAVMRRLADHAFMLRDWKLAYWTYELLRSDFNESKAWKHYAAVNEMATVSLLMSTQHSPAKVRAEVIDQMLESAFYSYNTRCSSPFGAARCLLVGVELLRVRGGSRVDDAARWGLRLLESKTLGQIGEALLKERLSVCYSSKLGLGSLGRGSRRRKAALMSILAAGDWIQQAKYLPAQRCIRETRRLYRALPSDGTIRFRVAAEYVESLRLALSENLDVREATELDTLEGEPTPVTNFENEAFVPLPPKRISIVSRANVLETAPLHAAHSVDDAKSEHGKQEAMGFE